MTTGYSVLPKLPSFSNTIADNEARRTSQSFVQDVPISSTTRSPWWERILRPISTSRTSFWMIACYVFALALAVAHLCFFLFLNDRRVGIDTSLDQSWVTRISFALAVAFRTSLSAALTIAFAQCMWSQLRKTTHSVAHIDRLYRASSDPIALFHWETILKTSLLFCICLLIWLLPVVIFFPPGTMIVVTKPYSSTNSLDLPTYNASYAKDDNWDNISVLRLASMMQYSAPTRRLVSLAKSVLLSSSIPSHSSPCGANCTLIDEFQGPAVTCDQRIYNETVPKEELQLLFTAQWDPSPFNSRCVAPGWWLDDIDVPCGYAQDRYPGTFSIGIFEPFALDVNEDTIWQTTSRLSCTPSVTTYTILTTYTNGNRDLQLTTKNGVRSLKDIWQTEATPELKLFQTESYDDRVPSMFPVSLAVTQNFAIIDSMVSTLSGNYTELLSNNYSTPVVQGPCPNATTSDVGGLCELQYSAGKVGHGVEPIVILPDHTLVQDTGFNQDRFTIYAKYNDQWNDPEITITERSLNAALQNITMGVLYRLPMGTSAIDASSTQLHPTFSFVKRSSLIAPYAVGLIAGLVPIILAILAIRRTSQTIQNNGFMQTMVSTLNSSESVRQKASDSESLNDPAGRMRLEQLNIMYGQINENESPQTFSTQFPSHLRKRRFGFGQAHEIHRPTRSHELQDLQNNSWE